MLSYPEGLPMKYVGAAPVVEVRGAVFYADLDGFFGSSGAPVFSDSSYTLVGIYTAGEDSWEVKAGCVTARVCEERECGGERVGSIQSILERLLHLKE
jgi:V8-like Glu-specific endopeptidase